MSLRKKQSKRADKDAGGNVGSLPAITKATLKLVRSQDFFDAQLEVMQSWLAGGLTMAQVEDRLFSFIIWVLAGMPESKPESGTWEAWWTVHKDICLAEFNRFNDKCEREFHRWNIENAMKKPDTETIN